MFIIFFTHVILKKKDLRMWDFLFKDIWQFTTEDVQSSSEAKAFVLDGLLSVLGDLLDDKNTILLSLFPENSNIIGEIYFT